MTATGRDDVTLPGAGGPHRIPEPVRSTAFRTGRHSVEPVRRYRGRSLLVAGLVLTATALPAGAAYAWWTASGGGSGSAAAGTLLPLEVSHNAVTPTTRLMPGQTGSVVLLVHNPNPVAVLLTSVVADTDPIGVSGGTGCTLGTSGVSFTDQTGLSFTIAAGVEWQEIELPDAVVMDSSSADGCQGASFAIPVQLTVRTP